MLESQWGEDTSVLDWPGSDRDREFAQIVLRQGYCGRETIAGALRRARATRAEGGVDELGQALVRNRDLTVSQFVRIQRSIAHGPFADGGASTSTPSEESSALSSIHAFGKLFGRIDWSRELDRIRRLHSDRLEIMEEIGRGGMATVYKARQRNLDRLVAVKVLALGSDAHLVERFHREARTSAHLDHPSIVKAFECGESEGTHYIVQEYVDGETLAQRIHRRGAFEATDAAKLLLTILEGLAHAHARGVLHRDLKPANILIDRRGQSKLTDFGLAFRAGEPRLSATGAILGTPAYMAPEQLDPRSSLVGPQTDVYGTGAVLYEMLTCRPPLDAPRSDLLFQAIVERVPRLPSLDRPQLDRRIEAICMKCLEKDPRARYASAEDLRLDLLAYLEGTKVRARTIGITSRLRRKLQFRSLRSWAPLLLVGVALAAYGLFGPSTVEVRSIPAGATIRIDGELAGRGTAERRIWFRRSCLLEVECEGFEPLAVRLELEPSTRHRETIPLRPIAP